MRYQLVVCVRPGVGSWWVGAISGHVARGQPPPYLANRSLLISLAIVWNACTSSACEDAL
jgi:hypothetical protein